MEQPVADDSAKAAYNPFDLPDPGESAAPSPETVFEQAEPTTRWIKELLTQRHDAEEYHHTYEHDPNQITYVEQVHEAISCLESAKVMDLVDAGRADALIKRLQSLTKQATRSFGPYRRLSLIHI